MASPNIQLQLLLRQYVKENKNKQDCNMTIQAKNFTIPQSLTITMISNMEKINDFFLEMDDNIPLNRINDKIISMPVFTEEDSYIDITEYLGVGLLWKLFKAEHVTPCWILYAHIISKIYKSFRTDTNTLTIRSLHFDKENCSIQTALHHTLLYSELKKQYNINWSWIGIASEDDNMELSNKWEKNFTRYMSAKYYYQQTQFIINKLCEKKVEKINLLIWQPKYEGVLIMEYIFGLTLALKFLDSNGIFLMQVNPMSLWGTEELHVLACLSMIFNTVYISRYNINVDIYCVLICKDKKKNYANANIIKKFIKCMSNSNDTSYIESEILKEIPDKIMLDINQYANDLPPAIEFPEIIDNLKEFLLINEELIVE